jgi:hypothetical protein
MKGLRSISRTPGNAVSQIILGLKQFFASAESRLFSPFGRRQHRGNPPLVGLRYRHRGPFVAELFVGFGRQEVHLVLRRDPNHLFGVRQIVQLVEQRFELLHRRYPEQRPRRLV